MNNTRCHTLLSNESNSLFVLKDTTEHNKLFSINCGTGFSFKIQASFCSPHLLLVSLIPLSEKIESNLTDVWSSRSLFPWQSLNWTF